MADEFAQFGSDQPQMQQMDNDDDAFADMNAQSQQPMMMQQQDGFQSVQGAFSAFQAPSGEDDYTPEEISKMQAVEQESEERKRTLFMKGQDEDRAKQDKKGKAYEDLQQWHATRRQQIEQKKRENSMAA